MRGFTWVKCYELSREYDEKRQDFISQYSVSILCSEEYEKQVQRMHRYRVFTENRIKELNRRLVNLRSEMVKKERLKDEKEIHRQKHEIAVAKLERPQFEQLMEYRNAGDVKNANVNSNPEPAPARQVILTPEDIEKVPPDWQKHKSVLTNIIPNAELFSLWTNEQLIESGHLMQYLMQQPGTNRHWIEQIRACQEYELQLRSLTVRNLA